MIHGIQTLLATVQKRDTSAILRCGAFQECYRFGERRLRRCPHGGILLLQKLLGLGGPWHQLSIDAEPVRLKLLPEFRPGKCRVNLLEEFSFSRSVVKKPSAGARVTDPNPFSNDSEPLACGVFVATHDHHRP